MTTIAIVQSSYMPWKGYFDLMRRVDAFVLYDCVQYTSRDWRNRNRIKTAHGPLWLSVPVAHESRGQRLCDTVAADDAWPHRHWETLRHAYGRSRCFRDYAAPVQALYDSSPRLMLSEINQHMLEGINRLLGINTPLYLLRNHLHPSGDKTQRLIDICRHFRADGYISGPRAQRYLDVDRFREQGIAVSWMDYSRYPAYDQPFPPFRHDVSMLDLLFNAGGQAGDYF